MKNNNYNTDFTLIIPEKKNNNNQIINSQPAETHSTSGALTDILNVLNAIKECAGTSFPQVGKQLMFFLLCTPALIAGIGSGFTSFSGAIKTTTELFKSFPLLYIGLSIFVFIYALATCWIRTEKNGPRVERTISALIFSKNKIAAIGDNKNETTQLLGIEATNSSLKNDEINLICKRAFKILSGVSTRDDSTEARNIVKIDKITYATKLIKSYTAGFWTKLSRFFVCLEELFISSGSVFSLLFMMGSFIWEASFPNWYILCCGLSALLVGFCQAFTLYCIYAQTEKYDTIFLFRKVVDYLLQPQHNLDAEMPTGRKVAATLLKSVEFFFRHFLVDLALVSSMTNDATSIESIMGRFGSIFFRDNVVITDTSILLGVLCALHISSVKFAPYHYLVANFNSLMFGFQFANAAEAVENKSGEIVITQKKSPLEKIFRGLKTVAVFLLKTLKKLILKSPFILTCIGKFYYSASALYYQLNKTRLPFVPKVLISMFIASMSLMTMMALLISIPDPLFSASKEKEEIENTAKIEEISEKRVSRSFFDSTQWKTFGSDYKGPIPYYNTV